MSYHIKELLLPDGSSPYADWFATLDALASAKVAVAAARMEQGNLSNVEWFRGIGEYKIDWGPGYRIYLAKMASRSSSCSAVAANNASSATSTKQWPCGKTTNTAKPNRKKEPDSWH